MSKENCTQCENLARIEQKLRSEKEGLAALVAFGGNTVQGKDLLASYDVLIKKAEQYRKEHESACRASG